MWLGFAVAMDGAAISEFAHHRGLQFELASRVYFGRGRLRRLKNLRAVTSDMNVFDTQTQFDRVVSVEMFEHMMNWRQLLSRVRSWLKPDGRFFMHIFTHRSGSYLFDRENREDWIAQHFFTSGMIPSHCLIRQYADLFEVEHAAVLELPGTGGTDGFRQRLFPARLVGLIFIQAME